MATLTLFLTIVAVLLVLWAVFAYGVAWLLLRRLTPLERATHDYEMSLTPAVLGVLGLAWLVARWLA